MVGYSSGYVSSKAKLYANYEAKGQSRAMFYNNNRRFIVTNLSSLALSLKIVIVRLWGFLISKAENLFSRREIYTVVDMGDKTGKASSVSFKCSVVSSAMAVVR